MWFLRQMGFQLQEDKHAYWGIVFRNSCRHAEECVAVAHGQADQERGQIFSEDLQAVSEIPFAHCGLCTKTLSHQTMPQHARKLLCNDCHSAYH